MNTEVCILAGGLSTRMGRDKAHLRLGGKTFLSRARAAGLGLGLPVRVIRRDLIPRCGPLGGVYTGLKTSSAEICVFLSCDMPFVTPELIERLEHGFKGKTKAVFLEVEGKIGFPFALRTDALRVVEELLRAGRLSIRELGVVLLAESMRLKRGEEHWGWNINTPEELERARALLKGATRKH